MLVRRKNQNLFSNQAQKFLIYFFLNHKFKILKNQAQTRNQLEPTKLFIF